VSNHVCEAKKQQDIFSIRTTVCVKNTSLTHTVLPPLKIYHER